MRWVLARPLNKSPYYDPEIQEPLGLEYLTSVLKKSGHEVLVLDSALDNLSDLKLSKRTVSFEPDAVGFSITTIQDLNSVLTIYNECRERLDKRKIKWVAGGNFVTTDTLSASELLPDDFILIKYEGELAVQNLVAEWDEKKKASLGEKHIIEGPIVENLDLLPFPERPYYQYLLHFGWAFNVQGSRGCCSSCKYCASSGMRNKINKKWRGRTPENIVKEISYLYNKYDAKTFNMVDEDFLGPPINALSRAKSFSDEIQNSKLNITFGIQVRPNSLSGEIIEYLVSAGLKYVFMGIESDRHDDFIRWGRAYCENTWQWVDLLQKMDVEVNAGTLLFHPECSLESIRPFAEKLIKHELFNYRTAVNRLDAMPGSYYHGKLLATQRSQNRRAGILPLPFINKEIENFYDDIRRVLAPLEAPSMHAICALPPVQTNRKVLNTGELKYAQLKDIINICDQQVSNCFFSILEMYEHKTYSETTVNKFLMDNIKLSLTIANNLVEKGFVRSPEMLYEAIRYEK